jgi:DNA polymerase-1
VTLFGRKRYLPDIVSHNATVRSFAERNAVNSPIQGTAADIIKMAMVTIHRRMRNEGLKAEMIMQVHDELNFNVPMDEVDRVREIVVSEMENVVHLTVPLIADCGVGKNWLEAH